MNKLKKLLNSKKVNIYSLAKKTGISPASIYNWSTGKSSPGVLNAIKIEKATKGEVSVYSWK